MRRAGPVPEALGGVGGTEQAAEDGALVTAHSPGHRPSVGADSAASRAHSKDAGFSGPRRDVCGKLVNTGSQHLEAFRPWDVTVPRARSVAPLVA